MMLRLKTILVPVDFSQRTEAEAIHAADIAKRFESRLILAHVIPRFEDGYKPEDPEALEAYSHEFSAEVERGVQKALQSLAGRVGNGAEVECVVLSGDPKEEIEKLVTAHQTDLIVIPTTGRGRVERQLLGSMTASLLHDLKCPLLTGAHFPEVERGETLYKNIACNVMHGEYGVEQLLWARDFAAPYDASLHVLCVLPFLDDVGAVASVPPPMRDKVMADTKEQLHSLIEREGVKADVTVLGGPFDQLLAPFVQAQQVDLLVSGRQRQQDRVGVFGLHTDMLDTANCSPCPIVLV